MAQFLAILTYSMWIKPRIRIGGRNTSNFRYAANTISVTENKEDMKVKEESEKARLQIKIKKTKVIRTAENYDIKIINKSEETESVGFYFPGFQNWLNGSYWIQN